MNGKNTRPGIKPETYKERCHRLYKLWKLKIIKEDDLSFDEKKMLNKYFGVGISNATNGGVMQDGR